MCMRILIQSEYDSALQKIKNRAKDNKIIAYKTIVKKNGLYFNWLDSLFEYKKGICVSSRKDIKLTEKEQAYQIVEEGIHVCLNSNRLLIQPLDNLKVVKIECDLNDLVALGDEELAVFTKVNFLGEPGYFECFWNKLKLIKQYIID